MLRFFQWFVCRVSRKVGLSKRRVRSHVVRGEIKNCTPLWRKAHFEVKMSKNSRCRSTFWSSDVENCTPLWRKAHWEVKMLKNWRCRSTFWSSDVEKLHAAVAKRTLGSENVQNTAVSEHFLKFRCRKIARRCGEKHIGKWKCTKHGSFGALFEVQMSKNCTPLWRKAHWEVKMLKNWWCRSTFWCSDVEKLHAAVAKRTLGSENVQNTAVSEHCLKFRCGKIARRCGETHIGKWKCTKDGSFGALFEVQMSKNCTPMWWKAHWDVKMYKTRKFRSTFWGSDVEKLVG